MAKEKKKATSQKAASKQPHPYQNPNHDHQTSNRFQQQNGSQNGIQNLFMGFQLRESDTTYCVDKAN